MKKGKFNIVMGGQAGSESKGKLAGVLVEKFGISTICMAASPNAGHTLVHKGRKYVSYHVPVSAVMNPNSMILLGPSSIINLDKMIQEVHDLDIDPSRIMVHPRAVIIHDSYVRMEKEQGLLQIGSTNQGVGVARMEKMGRMGDVTFVEDLIHMKDMIYPFYLRDTVCMVNNRLKEGQTVLCEMTQGFDLCLEHGIDPKYCTSKMIHPAMAMAEAGVSPKWIGHIYGVIRPYPIRVNNRDGSSGPYAEAQEITWKDVKRRSGCPHGLEELTTTTRLPRRVFEFSHQRFDKFMQVCSPDIMCLQFANYIDWTSYKLTDKVPLRIWDWIYTHIPNAVTKLGYIGTGEEEMVDCGIDYLV